MSKRLVVALSGGVGGAKLALGLSRVLPAGTLRRPAGLLLVDHTDADAGSKIEARVTIAKTLTDLQDRDTLARVTLDAADALASQR